MDDLHEPVAFETPCERRLIVRMKLDEDGAILRPQELANDERRAGIGAAVPLADFFEDLAVRRDQLLRLRRKGLIEPPDAAAPFLRPLRLVRGEIVEPAPRMGVDGAERGLLRRRCTSTRTSSTCFITSAKLPAWKACR
jgi:hypothetical protein